MKSEVLEKHKADVRFTKATRRDMDDEMTGAHEQISGQSVSVAKKTSATQKVVGALCNESGSGRSSGKTASQHYHAGAR